MLTLEGGYSHLLRIPAGSTTATEVPLPFKGYVSEAFADPSVPGITITQESWTVPPATFAYDHVSNRFTDLQLGTTPAFDQAFVVSDLESTAADGVRVPLTLIQPKNAKRPQITLLDAYGSYGLSELPGFAPREIVLMQEGVNAATCHVRGGGELGEQWRLGGKDANKPNTWRDLIACAQDLIARGITTKEKLFISGGSAGGIAMGMALTERPDLFAGVIDGGPRGQHDALRVFGERSAEHPRVRHHHDTTRLCESLRDGLLPARKGRRDVSCRARHHRAERSARVIVGTGEVRGAAAGERHAEPGVAAHRD